MRTVGVVGVEGLHRETAEPSFLALPHKGVEKELTKSL